MWLFTIPHAAKFDEDEISTFGRINSDGALSDRALQVVRFHSRIIDGLTAEVGHVDDRYAPRADVSEARAA